MEFLSYLHQLRFLYHKKEITNKPGHFLPLVFLPGLINGIFAFPS